MVNINIEIPDDLHKRLKLASLIEDKTLKEYVISVLEEAVRQDAAAKPARRGRPHE